MNKKVFSKGTVIFREGAEENWMYDIISGKVAIYSGYGTQQQKRLIVLENGFFGEMGMMEGKPRSATAVAVEDTVAACIDENSFDEYFRTAPGKIIMIMQHISSRMRDLSLDYVEACNAAAEYVKAEENQTPKDPELMARLKMIAGVGKRK